MAISMGDIQAITMEMVLGQRLCRGAASCSLWWGPTHQQGHGRRGGDGWWFGCRHVRLASGQWTRGAAGRECIEDGKSMYTRFSCPKYRERNPLMEGMLERGATKTSTGSETCPNCCPSGFKPARVVVVVRTVCPLYAGRH